MFSCSKDNDGPPPPPLSSSAEITEFSFSGIMPVAKGIIVGTDIKITVIGEETNVKKLVATFITTGASVKVNGTEQVSGTTANDFTSTIDYVVTAEDETTKTYTVTVDKQTQTSKEITAFSFKDFPDAVAVFSGENINFTLPAGTDIRNLVAEFSHTGKFISIDETPQISGITTNNFTSPKNYVVTALDGSTKGYSVTVTVLILPSSYEVSFATTNQVRIYPKYPRSPDANQTFAAYQSGETCTAATLPACGGSALANNGTLGNNDFYVTYPNTINDSRSFYLGNTFGGATQWQKITISPRFSGRNSFGNGVVFKDKLWIIGGLDNIIYKNDIWSSADGSSWAEARPVIIPASVE